MSNRDKGKIAELVRNLLVTEHEFKEEGDYTRKAISDNYGIGFGHDDEYPCYLEVYHREGSQFSPTQKSVIFEVLERREFIESYFEAEEGETSDGLSEIYATLRTSAFDGWTSEETAEWIVRLYEHFITTVELLSLT